MFLARSLCPLCLFPPSPLCPLNCPQLDCSAQTSESTPEISLAAMTFQLAPLLAYSVPPTSSNTSWVLLKCHSFPILKPMGSPSSPTSPPMQGDHQSSHPSSPDSTAFIPVTSFTDTGMEEIRPQLRNTSIPLTPPTLEDIP